MDDTGAIPPWLKLVYEALVSWRWLWDGEILLEVYLFVHEIVREFKIFQ